MIYEHRGVHPISRSAFLHRMARHSALALILALLSLAVGMAGYMYFENLPWRDAFVNAAMLMGGMGPVDAPRTDGGKVFAESAGEGYGTTVTLELPRSVA